MRNLLQSLKNTLNQVEVRGKNNLDMLLGCLLTIDMAIAELDRQEVKDTEGSAHEDTNERRGDA